MPEFPDYFRDKVIDDPGAFMVEAKNHASFAAAIFKNDECDRIRTEKASPQTANR